jgi:hypothetical protein
MEPMAIEQVIRVSGEAQGWRVESAADEPRTFTSLELALEHARALQQRSGRAVIRLDDGDVAARTDETGADRGPETLLTEVPARRDPLGD